MGRTGVRGTTESQLRKKNVAQARKIGYFDSKYIRLKVAQEKMENSCPCTQIYRLKPVVLLGGNSPKYIELGCI